MWRVPGKGSLVMFSLTAPTITKSKSKKNFKIYHGGKINQDTGKKMVDSGLPFAWQALNQYDKLQCLCSCELTNSFITKHGIVGVKCNKCGIRVFEPEMVRQLILHNVSKRCIPLEFCGKTMAPKLKFTVRGHEIFSTCQAVGKKHKCQCSNRTRSTNSCQPIPSLAEIDLTKNSIYVILNSLKNVRKRKFQQTLYDINAGNSLEKQRTSPLRHSPNNIPK